MNESATKQIRIIHDDIVSTGKIHPASIDLIVTSPPYNLGIAYNSYDDHLPHTDYLRFSERWLRKCYDLTKETGRLCLNVPMDNYRGGRLTLAPDLIHIATSVGWSYHTTIYWIKDKTFRAKGSWRSAFAPCVLAPVELIVVFCKKGWKKTSGTRKSDLTESEFVEWTHGVWRLGYERDNQENVWIDHPCRFPRELPRRCIKLFSYVGDIVLDPFLGSGTTLLEARLNNRMAIGMDIDEKYCQLAYRRCLSLRKSDGIFPSVVLE